MTVKAGQKCTAIRRAMAPAQHLDAVQAALSERLAKVRIGDPREEGVQMGALASQAQLRSVREAVAELSKSARIVSGDPDVSPVAGNGAFISPDPASLGRSLGIGRGPRRRGVRAGLDPDALSRSRRRHRARQSRHGQPRAFAVHLRSEDGRGVRARRRRLSRPHGDPRPQLAPRNRPATAPPCPSSSMAAPAAPAAARRWAAYAA